MIERLLENRHEIFLTWTEPRKACSPQGTEINAHLMLKATVHDCVNLQRAVAKKRGEPTMGNDAQFLEEFIVVNWAKEVRGLCGVIDRIINDY